MLKIIRTFRFAATLGLASLGGTSTFGAEQPRFDEAQNAAQAAQQVANEAKDAIRSIDPTTGGNSLMVDPSLPQPHEVELAAVESRAQPTVDVQSADTAPVVGATLPRDPATRMISAPVAQALPAPDPMAPPSAARVVNAAPAKADPFTLNSILPIPPGPFRYGDWYWDESSAPAKGKLVMTVDLDARVISVFRDGHEIGTAVALLGTKKHPTPLGTFPVLTKEKDNISEKYDNAPMPWTLRLTWDGIAIHGSPVINGYASHGCIGVPDEFAEKLFAAARRGDKVVITRGQIIGLGDKLG